jgi:hypothetical protein
MPMVKPHCDVRVTGPWKRNIVWQYMRVACKLETSLVAQNTKKVGVILQVRDDNNQVPRLAVTAAGVVENLKLDDIAE